MIKEKNLEFMIKAEVNIMKSLDCPNIIKFYDYFETNISYCILMEYCDEGNLIT